MNLRFTLCISLAKKGENMEKQNCCSNKKKERSEKEYKDLLNRLKRIEGQVRGVEKMVEKDAYCVDILTQVSAITAALNSFNKTLLANHIRTCVADGIREGNDETIDELVTTLQKLMK
jgi:DNA-binding FrmR family transcriptional regulator